ncbi:MAG TPA: glycosyltransferase family 4 protein [Alphaproteobacteria bacterium]
MNGAAARPGTRVLVHHPGSNHLAYELVAGLQQAGFACDLDTGFFYTPDGLAARLTRTLPTRWRGRVERELKRRSHPAVDPRRLRLLAWPELAYVALNRLGLPPGPLARVVGWRNEVFDRWVAARVRRERPRIVVGHDSSALLAQRAARDIGAVSVLNQVIGHIDAGLEIFREEAEQAPEFAETLTVPPQWIVERCRGEALEADRVLVPSDYVQDTLVQRGTPAERIAVLPYGVDVERFRPRPSGERKSFRLLFVGSLSQRKGIKYLLEAVRRLKLPDAELVLVGRMIGSAAAFHPYDGLFRHVTHVPYHEVHGLYADADVFVYPSLHEGSAFATYEALASGLPVIATPNTGSVVRDEIDGFLVPPRDVDALMAKIELLYRDRTRRAEMARSARARAEEFTWSAYRARLAALFDGFVADRSLSK